MANISCPFCGNLNPSDISVCSNCGKTMSRYSSDGTLAKGTIIKDRYKVIDLIKIGGMGAVYLGEDISTGSSVAVKELFVDDSQEDPDEVIISRFEREANLLSRLVHQNLPRVSDYFYDCDNYFMIMDYIEGLDLETILERDGNPGLPESKVIEWAVQICSVLVYLHNYKPMVLYRDIKPSNIVIRKTDNLAILIDFGIARPIEEGLTSAKTIIGTVGYSPPEQYEGKPRPQSDIYSLGATLHHLLTGKFPTVPFEFEQVRKLNPAVSLLTEQVVMKALEFEIKERYNCADDMRNALLYISKKGTSPPAVIQKTKNKSEHKGKDSAELARAHSNLGVLYAREGSYERAREEFEQAIVIDPSSSEVHSNLGYVSLMLNDYDSALGSFNKAIELNPRLSGAYCNLGVLYKRKGMLEDAMQNFKKALLNDNTLAHAHINIAHIYGLRQMYKNMIEECEKAIRKKPECIEAYINFAYGCGKTGDHEKGIKRLEKALLFDSSNAAAHSNLGVLYGETGQYDKAISSFDKAISIDPDYAEAYSNLGIIYYKQGNYAGSKEAIKKAVRLNPDLIQAKTNLARFCKKHGIEEREKNEIVKLLSGQPEEIQNNDKDMELSASPLSPEDSETVNGVSGFFTFPDHREHEQQRKRLEAQITIIPNEPAPYIELGRHYVECGNIDEGIRHYQRSLRIDPCNVDAHFNLAMAYEKKGLNFLAETEYKKVIKIQPKHILSCLHLGNIFFNKGDFQGALELYETILNSKNDMYEVYYRSGLTYKALKKYKPALASFEKALKGGFDSSDLYFNLGVIYYDHEHLYDKAEEYFKSSISKNLSCPEAHLFLGNIYYNKKLLNEAMWQYEEAIALKEDYAIAYSNLGAVYNDLDNLAKAEEFYYRSLQLDKSIAEAHRNLGVLYQKKGDFIKAIEEMEIYLSLGNPEDAREIMKRIKDMEFRIKEREKAKR